MTPVAAGIMNALLLVVFFLMFLAAVGLWDKWAANRWGVEGTISRGMQRLWYFWPGIAFAMGLGVGYLLGFLSGHFGAPQPPLVGG